MRRARSGRRTDSLWAALRERALRSAGRRCSKCGGTENLEVDHIDGDPANNVLENLAVMCHACHVAKTTAQAREAKTARPRPRRRSPRSPTMISLRVQGPT
jgi:5-methylcytosine-specific restriction endonuclease McrA